MHSSQISTAGRSVAASKAAVLLLPLPLHVCANTHAYVYVICQNRKDNVKFSHLPHWGVSRLIFELLISTVTSQTHFAWTGSHSHKLSSHSCGWVASRSDFLTMLQIKILPCSYGATSVAEQWCICFHVLSKLASWNHDTSLLVQVCILLLVLE